MDSKLSFCKCSFLWAKYCPLSHSQPVILHWHSLLEIGEEKNCQNTGVSAELLALVVQAVKQVNAAGLCCRYVWVQLTGGICRRFAPI